MNLPAAVLMAMAREAGAVLGSRGWRPAEGLSDAPMVHYLPGLLCARSGMGVENAARTARWAVSHGVSGLIVLGTCGGLKPGLKQGDVIIADTVIHGTRDFGSFSTHLSAALSAQAFLQRNGITCHVGAVVTRQEPALSSIAKRALFEQTRALAVDMESSAAARVAAGAHLPVFVLRAVCDPMDQSVPQEIFGCLDENGSVQGLSLMKLLLKRPALFPAVFRAARGYTLALSSLKKAWRLLHRINLPRILEQMQ